MKRTSVPNKGIKTEQSQIPRLLRGCCYGNKVFYQGSHTTEYTTDPAFLGSQPGSHTKTSIKAPPDGIQLQRSRVIRCNGLKRSYGTISPRPSASVSENMSCSQGTVFVFPSRPCSFLWYYHVGRHLFLKVQGSHGVRFGICFPLCFRTTGGTHH